MIKYKTIKEKNISIHKNVLIENGTVTAFFVLYPFNYDLMDSKSAERHIEKIYNVISNLYSSLGEIKISMFQLKNIVSKEETIKAITKTIRMYSPDYKEFPEEYHGYIKNITRDFSILSVNINVRQSIDIENQSIKEILSQIFDSFMKENFSTNVVKMNLEQIDSQNTRIKNTLSRFAVPANEKLVMNIYVNNLFPSYNLVYNDHLMNNREDILSGITQEITPYLGWFEMSNSGIVAFGGTPRVTYGSILTILSFPESIENENFNISVPGLFVNMKLLEKNKAMLRFKRIRADVLEEQDEFNQIQARDSDVDDESDLAQFAVNQIRRGSIMTDVDANILITANTKEDLDKKKKTIISILSDIHVVCSIAGNQSKTFVYSILKKQPLEYYHSMDLRYALSFQLDNGVLVGDQDSKFTTPVIGRS